MAHRAAGRSPPRCDSLIILVARSNVTRACCDCCGADLSGEPAIVTQNRQVFEVASTAPTVIEYQERYSKHS